MTLRLLPIALVFVLLAGCERSSPEELQTGPEAPDALESASRIVYQCESGATVEASYPTDSTAVVQYQGRTVYMDNVISGSGARYVGEDLEWWTKGTGAGADGTLSRLEGEQVAGASNILERCQQAAGDQWAPQEPQETPGL